MCLTPISVRSKAGHFVTAPCGICAQCCEKRRNDWFIRLKEHSKDYESMVFVTLTYSEENVPFGINPTLCRRDPQLFLKRLRKHIEPRRISYYLVGEYGTRTWRPHYHAIIFGISIDEENIVKKSWNLGFVSIGSVTERSLNYVCKYHVLRGKNPPNSERSFALMSKGIGIGYVDRMKLWHQEGGHLRSYYSLYQYKKPLPRYYKEKLFTRYQLDDIAEKTQERYVEKMLKESKDEDAVNYFKNKLYQTMKKNENFKRKAEESGTL